MAAARSRRSRRSHTAREPRSSRERRTSSRLSISSSSTPHGRERADSEDSDHSDQGPSEVPSHLSAASSRASSLRSVDLNPPGKIAYTFRHASNSDKRAIRRARFTSNAQIIRYRTVTHANDSRPTYVFGVEAQYEVVLSPAHTLACSCTDKPSRATICEHVWAVQEALLEHSSRANEASGTSAPTWRFDCLPAAVVSNVDRGESELVYQLFERDGAIICRRLGLGDPDNRDEDRLHMATKQILCAVSPSALLPQELFDNEASGEFPSFIFQRMSNVILREARSDPRIHEALHTIAPPDEIQALLLQRQRSRLDAIFSLLTSEQRLTEQPARDADLDAMATQLRHFTNAVHVYSQTFSSMDMLTFPCRRGLVSLLLTAIEHVIEAESHPRAQGVGANLFDRLIGAPPAFALEALHGLGDVFTSDQDLRLRASQCVKALLRMRTPTEYITALKAIAQLV